MEGATESAQGIWSVTECPFSIEYSTRVLDDIRLAVMEAFFFLPRGGVEIGGILLGKWEHGRLSVLDHAALECEHALGPSFTLSEADHARIAELLAAAGRSLPDSRPVGWYHSHTRSEIFLSDADIAIHKRYFPEPWQVALVLKPHTFRPMRCGFFFREADGALRGAATLQEFELTPLPTIPAPAGRGKSPGEAPPPSPSVGAEPAPDPPPAALIAREQPTMDSLSAGPEVPLQPVPETIAPPFPRPDSEQPDLPYGGEPAEPELAEQDLAAQAPAERPGPGMWFVVAAGLLLAAAAAGFEMRYLWLPAVQAAIGRLLPVPASPSVDLNALDANGELQIRWNRDATAVRGATGGLLQIRDGGPLTRSFRLDISYLQSGIFLYPRQGDRVDVELVLDQSDGRQVREVASFLGGPPTHPNQPLEGVIKELQEGQRQRLRNQDPDLAK